MDQGCEVMMDGKWASKLDTHELTHVDRDDIQAKPFSAPAEDIHDFSTLKLIHQKGTK